MICSRKAVNFSRLPSLNSTSWLKYCWRSGNSIRKKTLNKLRTKKSWNLCKIINICSHRLPGSAAWLCSITWKPWTPFTKIKYKEKERFLLKIKSLSTRDFSNSYPILINVRPSTAKLARLYLLWVATTRWENWPTRSSTTSRLQMVWKKI